MQAISWFRSLLIRLSDLMSLKDKLAPLAPAGLGLSLDSERQRENMSSRLGENWHNYGRETS